MRFLIALLLSHSATDFAFEISNRLEGESVKCWAHISCFSLLLDLGVSHLQTLTILVALCFLGNVFNIFYLVFLIVTRGRIGVKQPRRPLPKQNAFSELAELNIHVLDNMFFLFSLNIFCILFFLIVQNFILTHIVSQNSFCFYVTTLC